MLQFMYRSSRPLDKEEGAQSPKKVFLALRASVWSKNKRGWEVGHSEPLPGSATANSDKQISMIFQGQITVFKD